MSGIEAVARRAATPRFRFGTAFMVAAMWSASLLLDGCSPKTADGDKAQFARLAAEMDGILAAEASVDGKTLDMAIHTTGDAAVLEKIIKGSAFRMRAAVLAYRGTIKSLDYPHFIEPERLAQKGGLADATKRIAQIHAAFDTLHKAVLSEQDGMRRALAAAAVPAEIRGPMLAQLDRRIATDGPKVELLFGDQSALFDEVAAMVNDLRHSKAHWTAKGRHMQFYDQGDLDTYKAHGNRLRTLEAKIAGERHAVLPAPVHT